MRFDCLLGRVVAALAVLVVGFVVLTTPRIAFAADHSEYMTITDLWIIDKDGTKIDLDKGDDPAAYSNGLAASEKCGWGFAWRLNLDDGHQLLDGDTARLQFEWPEVSRANFAPSPLVDDGGTQIGTWEIVADDAGNNTAIFTFNENVAGKTSLEEGRCQTASQYSRQGALTRPEVRTITLAVPDKPSTAVTKTYLAEAYTLIPLSADTLATKQSSATSNKAARWNIYLGWAAEYRLTKGLETPSYKDLLIEDTIEAGIKGVRFSAMMCRPVTGTSPEASTSSTSFSIDNKFTELTQKSGESYDAFRGRVRSRELNWGVYVDAVSGESSLLVYLGDFPSKALGTWEKNGAYDYLNNTTDDLWNEDGGARKDQWIAAHGSSNAYEGLINIISIQLDTTHDPVVAPFTITNYAYFTHDAETMRRGGRATLQPLSGQVVPKDPTIIELIKYDESTSAVISGATFRLEWREPGQTTWNAFGDDQRTYTTDDEGKVLIDHLPSANREYRFVEVSPGAGYLAGSQKFYRSLGTNPIEDDVHFSTTTSDSEGHLIYCSNKKVPHGSVTVSKRLEGNTQDSLRDFQVTVTATLNGNRVSDGTYGDVEFVGGEATFTLKGGESKTIGQLQEGTVYTVEEADYTADGYVTTYRNASGECISLTGGKVQGTVGNNSRATVQIVNTLNTYSNLTITKAIAGNAADPNEEFGFKVTVTDVGGAITEETFSLKGGQSKVIEDVPNDATYEVAETDTKGYESAVTSGSATGTIAGGTDAAVTFTNTRDTFGDLVISKAVAGDNPGRVASFGFTVTAADAKGAPLVGDFGGVEFNKDGQARVSVAPGAPVTIAGLPNGATYRVEEDDYSADGYATASEGAEGTIVGGETSTASFTNTRSADGTLTVSKAVAGTAARADDRFSFEVVLDDDTVSGEFSGVAFEGGRATLELAGGESVTIEGLPHGTGWTVTETDALDYEPDATELSGTVDEDAPSVAAFTNRRSYAPVTVDPPLRKVVEGTDAADEFTFLMRAVSSTVPGMIPATMPMPEGSEGGAKRVTRAGGGEYEFGEFQVALPGTYAYEMSEVPGTLPYDYDTSTYTVTYVVVAEGTQLRATRTITRDGEPADSVTFTNVWSPAPHYGVIHRYEGEHPEDVAATLPTDTARYPDGSIVSPMPPTAESVEAEGGTWAFRGWDAESKTVEGADVEFVGTWEFVAEKKEDPKKEENKEQGQSSGGSSSSGSGGSSASSASRAATPATSDPTGMAWVCLGFAGVVALAAARLTSRRRR